MDKEAELKQKRLHLSPEQKNRLADRMQGAFQQKRTKTAIIARRDPAIDKKLWLSSGQQRLWFLDQLAPDSAFYNIALTLQFEGELSISILFQCLQKIISRHEALRTHFVLQDDEPVQIISPYISFACPIIDWSAIPEDQAQVAVEQLLHKEATIPFNLSYAPLMRMNILRLNEKKHLLLLTMHHIIADGWSIGILQRELLILYDAFNRGISSPLAPLPLQYADYALWQRLQLREGILQKQLTYWHQQLTDLSPLELPIDNPRMPSQTFQGLNLSFSLSPDLKRQVSDFCKQENITLFNLLLAAFQMLLAFYSGQRDIAVGTPVSGRIRVELEDLVGCFINTLVIRSRFSDHWSLKKIVQHVRGVINDAFDNQEVPFERLIEELNPERSGHQSPLIQTLFTLKVPTSQMPETQELRIHAYERESDTTQFDLMLTMSEEQGNIIGIFHYQRDLFDPQTIQRLATHFQILLEAIVTRPAQVFGHLLILTDEEKQLLIGNRGLLSECPVTDSLATAFDKIATENPDRIALIMQDEHLTYIECNRRANSLALHLCSLGVQIEQLVGICMERSFALIIGILGILKAGAAYVPLDPHYPVERLTRLCDDAGLSIVVTQPPLATDRISPLGRSFVYIGENGFCDGSKQSQEVVQHLPHVAVDNLAYVLYTSGSTGHPKGVMVTHAQVRRLFLATQPWYQFNHQDIWTLFHSYAFDFSVWEIWGPLLHSGKLIVVPYDVSRTPSLFYELLEQQAVTVLNQTPSAFTQLLQQEELEPRIRRMQMRAIIFGGEALNPQRLIPWIERHQDAKETPFVNMYGITETTVHVTYRSLTSSDILRGSRSVIGTAIPDLQVYILNTSFQPVPVGVSGELFIGGAGVARGYLQRPDLTAERFLPDPFSQKPGARLYRSGDLARRLPDNDIEYLGRIDDQVKIRGFRIELGEIETAILQMPDIQEAVVLLQQSETGDKYLVAYVVPDPESVFSRRALRQSLQNILPDYMLPSFIINLDKLPLNTNGKLDRKALPRPELTSDEILTEQPLYIQTPLLELLSVIWCEVLGYSHIDPQMNFFELGGHSIKATQVLARIHTVLHVNLPLKSFFELPTIAGLAALVEQALRGDGFGREPIERVTRSSPLPLSFAQQRLWFLDQFISEPAMYMLPMVVLLHGKLHVAILHSSLHKLIQRHESLRTIFADQGGKPVQVILDRLPFSLPVIDLSRLETTNQQKLITHLAEQESQVTFHLQRGPLIRGKLVRLTGNQHILLLTLHHIIVDAWSLGIIVKELAYFYECLIQKKTPSLNDLAIQQADFAAWQQQWLQDATLKLLLSYWREQLRGARALDLPTDRPLLSTSSHRGSRYRFSLPTDLTQSLQQLSNREQVTLFMTLLAAFQTLLYRWTGQTDILLGTDIAGRTREELEGLIGFFVNLLILRTDLSGAPTFQELLRRVRSMLLDAYAHQDLPFEKLVDGLQLSRTTGQQTPLVRALFVFQNTPMPPLELPDITMQPLDIDPQIAKFDLATFLWESPDGLVGMIDYRVELFNVGTIETLVKRFEVLLRQIVEQPEALIDTYTIFTPEEIQQKEHKDQGNYESHRKKIKSSKRQNIVISAEA